MPVPQSPVLRNGPWFQVPVEYWKYGDSGCEICRNIYWARVDSSNFWYLELFKEPYECKCFKSTNIYTGICNKLLKILIYK